MAGVQLLFNEKVCVESGLVKVEEGQVKDFGSARGGVQDHNGSWEGEGGCRPWLFIENIVFQYFELKLFFHDLCKIPVLNSVKWISANLPQYSPGHQTRCCTLLPWRWTSQQSSLSWCFPAISRSCTSPWCSWNLSRVQKQGTRWNTYKTESIVRSNSRKTGKTKKSAKISKIYSTKKTFISPF